MFSICGVGRGQRRWNLSKGGISLLGRRGRTGRACTVWCVTRTRASCWARRYRRNTHERDAASNCTRPPPADAVLEAHVSAGSHLGVAATFGPEGGVGGKLSAARSTMVVNAPRSRSSYGCPSHAKMVAASGAISGTGACGALVTKSSVLLPAPSLSPWRDAPTRRQ